MAAYAYRCQDGHEVVLVSAPIGSPPAGLACTTHRSPLRRDYHAEGVGLTGMVQLKREREAGGRRAVRDLFLPTARDFAGPDDPDGTKGLQQWGDEHEPRPGNKSPLYPDIPKRVF